MGVEFNENRPTNYNYQPKSSGGISGLIIKMGLAKNTAGANVVMIVICVVCIALAIYISI